MVITTDSTRQEGNKKYVKESAANREKETFDDAIEALNKTITDTPELSNLQDNIQIGMTSESIRIQIFDRKGGVLFHAGSANIKECTRELLDQIARAVADLPNNISISGHPYANPLNRGDYSNWELSSDRANASRREVLPSGIDPSRFVQVISKAVQEPLI